MQDHSLHRFLIQIDRPNAPLNMKKARSLLEPAGVELDVSYGPVCINPKLGRYVVRGVATPEAKSKAEQIGGVQFFMDGKVSPT